MTNLKSFLDFCKAVQPQSQKDIQRFFEGVVYFPYDKELLLQSFLYLNLSDYFPNFTDLLLFEKALDGSSTHDSKCDFIFLTEQQKIALVETKYIDTDQSGATAKKRRNHHRNKVFAQVKTLKQKIVEKHSLSPELIDCYVFTTEDLSGRAEIDIASKYILIQELEKWTKKSKGN